MNSRPHINLKIVFIMIKFPYYIICKLVKDLDGNFLPEFLHCELIDEKFYRITSLTEYLQTGKGVSDELIHAYDGFIKINSNVSTLNFNF